MTSGPRAGRPHAGGTPAVRSTETNHRGEPVWTVVFGVVRPSRQPLRGFLRMTSLFNAIINLRHSEEAQSEVSKDAGC